MAVRAALIGCGAIAREHARSIEQVDGIDLTAFCDIDIARARSFLNEYGGRYATDDVRKVLGDSAVDAIYICTLHDTHAPLAIASCAAGKHVMLEKPMAMTVADCLAIAEAAERHGVILMTAFKLRYYPLVLRAKEYVPQPKMIIAQVMDKRWPDDFWGQDPIKGGGNVFSQGCHAMDLIYYLNGTEPRTISSAGGTLNHSGSALIDSLVSAITFDNGFIASVAQSDGGETPLVSKWSFQLTDGVRSVHLHNRLKSGLFFDGEFSTTYEDSEEFGMLEENRAFMHALETGEPPPTTALDGTRATAVILAGMESARTSLTQRISW